MAARDRVRSQADAAPPANGGDRLPSVLRTLTDPKTKLELAKALPAGLDVERYVRVARTAVQANPDLLRCDTRSLIAAIHKAAAYGLDVGPTEQAYLVPYKNQAQLIIGYRGIIALARNSGELKSIEAREVCTNDLVWEYEYGLDPKLRHKPALKDRGELECFWGQARFTNGGFYMVVVDLDTIEEHRRASPTGNSEKGPWRQNYRSMGRKTVIRIMEPYLPLSTEAREVILADESTLTDPDTYTYIETTGEENPDPEPEPEPEPEEGYEP